MLQMQSSLRRIFIYALRYLKQSALSSTGLVQCLPQTQILCIYHCFLPLLRASQVSTSNLTMDGDQSPRLSPLICNTDSGHNEDQQQGIGLARPSDVADPELYSNLMNSSESSDAPKRVKAQQDSSNRRLSNYEQRHRTWAVIARQWLWELLAWLSGTLCVVVIIVLLVSYNGKLLSQWRSNISLNTIAAILSQAAVSALLVSVSTCIGQMKWEWYHRNNCLIDMDLFDSASRGPQGSLYFLWKFRGAA